MNKEDRLLISLFLILFLILLNSEFRGEELISIYHRPKISLAGHWEIIIDPYDVGESYGFYKIDRPLERWERQEYQFIPQNYLQVPGDWNTQRPHLFFYEGSIWYRKKFFFSKQKVYQEKSCWVNNFSTLEANLIPRQSLFLKRNNLYSNLDFCQNLLLKLDSFQERQALGKNEDQSYQDNIFLAPKEESSRFFIYFGAANYRADVWLNGQKLGNHQGGFTPFNFEITDKLKEGENFLVVKVNNSRDKDEIPALETDWWNYGGLTRDVFLVELPSTFIQDFYLQLKKGELATIEGWVKLNGPQRTGQKISLNLAELKIKKEFVTDDDGLAKFELAARPKLWSPENPKLYHVEIKSPSDEIIDRIGFRTIEVKGKEIRLNGQPLFLRGICLHEEAPFGRGRAFAREDAEILLGWAKELGCNFVRLAHYPHNEYMIRVAEKTGLFVWEEIPVYWGINFNNSQTLEKAKNQLREIISRDKNRANVILWSVANETPVNQSRLNFLGELIQEARRLDYVRLITAATQLRYEDESTVVISDPLGEFLDVIGVNEYIGWYDGLPEKCTRVKWKTVYNKPVIISEFGGDALAGYHGDELTRWTEEFQANLYRQTLAMLASLDFVQGISPWILKDFRSPRRFLPGIQDFYNRKGLFSEMGQKKQAFFILQEYYRKINNKN